MIRTFGLSRCIVSLALLSLASAALLAQGAPPTAPKPGLRLAQREASITAGGSITAEIILEIPEGLHQGFDEAYFYARLIDAPGFSGGATIYPEPTMAFEGYPAFSGRISLGLPVSASLEAAPGNQVLTIEVGWQLCYDSGACLMPMSERLSLPVEVASGSTVAMKAVGPSADGGIGLLEILAYLGLGLLGGIILNVMPCVLPVLSIKVISLVRRSGEDRAQRRKHALAGAAGILAFMLALAGIVIALKAGGAAAGWGFQFQNPWYVMGLAAFVYLFSLSLFGLFSFMGPSLSVAKGEGLLASFGNGILTALLATPCSAPFLGTALGFAFQAPWYGTLGLFAMVGIGLALPSFLLSIVPGLLKLVPKPGPWMETFKQAMGFLLAGTAIWLATVLASQVAKDVFDSFLWFILALSFAAWAYGRVQASSAGRLKRALASAAIAIGLSAAAFTLLPFGTVLEGGMAPYKALEKPWERFSGKAVQASLDAGNPAFVAFGADWCLTCKLNEAGALRDAALLDAFAAKGARLFKGDYTNADQEIDEWLKRYGRAGVPFYLLLKPGEPPILFPELITSRMIIEEL
jgi:thiol:disulfide interchange protein DsbD